MKAHFVKLKLQHSQGHWKKFKLKLISGLKLTITQGVTFGATEFDNTKAGLSSFVRTIRSVRISLKFYRLEQKNTLNNVGQHSTVGLMTSRVHLFYNLRNFPFHRKSSRNFGFFLFRLNFSQSYELPIFVIFLNKNDFAHKS